MKIKYCLGVLLGAVLVAVFASVLSAQPEEVVLDNVEVFEQKQRPAVIFPHEQHMEVLSCTDCHHQYEDGENVLDEDMLEEGDPDIRCASCHRKKGALRRAFHRQCTGCHTDTEKQGKS